LKKQRTKGIVLVVVCFICVMCICSGFHKAQSEELSEIPDAVNSTRFNTTEHLTVVANQEEIADKEELAKQIIKMCRENSIKFSYDMVCPTELQISVYKTEKDLNDNKQFCEIAYLLDEENGEYDIIHNPEKFILYVDGEKVE
jgi:hypothetical protein